MRLPKQSKDPNFLQNLRPIGLLSTTVKLFEKLLLRRVQKHTEERDLLNESQFGFNVRHNKILQYMSLQTTSH
jgi:hypothetical protein